MESPKKTIATPPSLEDPSPVPPVPEKEEEVEEEEEELEEEIPALLSEIQKLVAERDRFVGFLYNSNNLYRVKTFFLIGLATGVGISASLLAHI